MKKGELKTLHCTDLEEANRVITVLHHDMWVQYKNKVLWFRMFLIVLFVQPIIVDFMRGVWKGVFG